MDLTSAKDRRAFLRVSGALGVGLLVSSHAAPLLAQRPAPDDDEEENISPSEDLMREHGLLNRVLLVYEEAVRRLDANADLRPELLTQAAGIIRHFIEDYHEKLEEDYLFPRFEKADTLTDLVKILREQHQAGRRVTAAIEQLSTLAALKNDRDRKKLAELLRAFVRMYRPHEAREDTVLFPAFRRVVSPTEYAALGGLFEDRERKLFGADGFEQYVIKVGALEQELGIYYLQQFTPRT